MSLSTALQIGRSGLLNSQTALTVVGNNLANAGTQGYHRQSIHVAPSPSQRIQQDVFIGTGSQLLSIDRQIDQALEGRLRSATADQSQSSQTRELLTQVQSIENAFGDSTVSTQLGAFFDAWSNVANNPQDTSLRALVTQQATTLTDSLNTLYGKLTDLRSQVDRDTSADVKTVNNLLEQVESLNHAIVIQGGGSDSASGLHDQRDALLSQLSSYMDISTHEQPTGMVDVYVGSTPIVLNGDSRGVAIRTTQDDDGQTHTQLAVAADGKPLNVTSGKLGALSQFRQGDLGDELDAVNQLAGQIIWQVNRLHSQGQGLSPLDSVTGTTRVADADAALNAAAAGLAFAPQHGSFQLNVVQKSTGQVHTSTIAITLDGVDPANQTTLNSLVAQLNTVANVTASVTADGRLKIDGGGDFQIGFAADSSGVLAALGVNTFFAGSTARDIAVNADVAQSPSRLAVSGNGSPGDNGNALAIAALRDTPIDALGGSTLMTTWNSHVADFASRLSAATSQTAADQLVRQNLQAQQQNVSGVNVDEQTIDLMSYQRTYQASARFLSVVDQLMQTLLQMV